MSWNYALPIETNGRTVGSFSSSASILWKSLTTLSSPPRPRSILKMAGLLLRVAISFSMQRKIAGLFKDPVLYEVARSNPRLPYKHLTSRYLLLDLPISVRAECFFHHYDRLSSLLPIWLLRQTLLDKVTLFELHEDGLRLAITMCLSNPFDREGELSLNLEMGDKIIYVMGFSIVPGRVVQLAAKDIFLISRLQGVRGFYQELSKATKTLDHVGPIALLIAALQGIGSALGIDMAACISGTKQVSYSKEHAESFKRSYDDFFLDRGIPLNEAGFFAAPLPLRDKPLEEIKRGHKIRTREKRALRQEIQQACVDFFAMNGVPVS